jgi:hypothetical protein
LTEVAWLKDKAPSDQTRVAKCEAERNDSARASTEHKHVAKTECIEEGSRVVSVLRGALSRPIVTTASQGSAAIVGNGGESA